MMKLPHLLLGLAACVLSYSGAALAQEERRAIKVVVVAMYEIDEPRGDDPGELQLWVERLALDTQLPFPTGENDLFLNGNASFEASTTSGTVGFIVHSACSCWNFRLSVKQTVRPNDTSVSFQLRLAGLGEDRDRSRARVLR